MTTIDPAVFRTPDTGLPPFWQWVNTVPGRLAILATAASVVAGKLLPQSMIPEPLDALREFGVAFVMVAFLLAWVSQAWLRRHVRVVVTSTTLALVALIFVRQAFVKPVHYNTEELGVTRTETVWFVTGFAVTDPRERDTTAEDLIKNAGQGWDELRAVWGGSFVSMAGAYSGLYLLVLAGFVLSMGAIDLGHAAPAHASRQPAAGNKKKKRR